MRPTIKDVAKKAGVSIATVSRILNDLPGYTAETRQTVLDVIQEIGYKPNAIARGLVNKHTNTIGVLLPSISSRLASVLLNGIENTAHHLDYSTIICNTERDGKRTLEYLEVLGEKQVDGIIIVSEWLRDLYEEALVAMKIPVVLVLTVSSHLHIPHIKLDDKRAAYDATEYLIERGHKKIGMISGAENDQIAGIPRVEGYRQALTDNSLSISEDRIVHGDFAYRSGIACMEKLFERCPDITAVFATSDEMAVGVLSWAYKKGVRVPDELSVIGYDDTQDAEMAIPPLTTVRQPVYEMGQGAVEMLFSGKKRAESVIMPHRIVERDSVRRIE
ncbi:MAG: LacI family DNA-binding transcriptional regulator [Spirochaetaceae bacterium]|nr:LacI family DNA-binding transcriptional regulator [Spirochaetaceae bacterium]